MLNALIHWEDEENWRTFLICSCCGAMIHDIFDACATFPIKSRRLNDHSPSVLLIPLDWTRVLTTHSGLCSDMALEMAELEWKAFTQENLGDFTLQMLLDTTDQRTLSQKKKIILKDRRTYDS